jgi:MFS family permease
MERKWLVVGGSFVALALGAQPMVLIAFTVLMPAIIAEMGWSRGEISLAALAFTFAGAAAMPIFGRLIDRYGLLRCIAAGAPLFLAMLGSISLTSANPLHFVALYGLLGLLGTALTPLPYAKAIAQTFDSRRGFALGMAMAGTGFGSAIIPIVASAAIGGVGWRLTYLVLASISAVGAVAGLALIRAGLETQLRERVPAPAVAIPDAPAEPIEVGGDALVFARLAGLVILASVALNGIPAHMATIAGDRGASGGFAAALVSIAGLSSLVGRLIAGWLLDRWHAANVGTIFFTLALVGIALLLRGGGPATLPFAACALGLALGGEIDLVGYMVSRYFELRRYGELYGWLLAIFTFGAGAGAFIMGMSFDLTGSYTAALVLFTGSLAASILLLRGLGPYRYAAAQH